MLAGKLPSWRTRSMNNLRTLLLQGNALKGGVPSDYKYGLSPLASACTALPMLPVSTTSQQDGRPAIRLTKGDVGRNAVFRLPKSSSRLAILVFAVAA